MNWLHKLASLSWEDIHALLQKYESYGPLPGILVPIVDSYIPITPLIAVLIANANAYGLWKGILLSWVGVVIGSISVFLLIRHFGGRFRLFLERKLPRSEKFIVWVENHGFTPIFLLSCFPFTPTIVINVVSGLSRLPFHTFLIATILGKGVMITIVSLAGHDISSMINHPWKLVIVVIAFFLLWLSGRKLEARYMK